MTDSATIWSEFTHDPRDPQVAGLRASDQDRSVLQQVLTDAYADGRLDRDEYDERSDRANAARTLGELPAIVSDLIAVKAVEPARAGLAHAGADEIHRLAVEAYRSDRREAVFGFLFATLVCTVIWFLVTRDVLFWPGFVALGTGINVAKTVSRKRDIVASHERRLRKKQAKELGQPWKPNDQASE